MSGIVTQSFREHDTWRERITATKETVFYPKNRMLLRSGYVNNWLTSTCSLWTIYFNLPCPAIASVSKVSFLFCSCWVEDIMRIKLLKIFWRVLIFWRIYWERIKLPSNMRTDKKKVKDDVFSVCNSSIRYKTMLLTGIKSIHQHLKYAKKNFGITNSFIWLYQVKAAIKLSIRESRGIRFNVLHLISLSA